MNIKRKLELVYAPPAQPGFLGAGHIARSVIQTNFSDSDPFIMLMDDMLDKNDNVPVGGPHPHAGFETVSLMLEGEFGEGTDSMKAGDFELMTAGRGIVHTEIISHPTKMRLLQLWLNLPRSERRALPRIQKLQEEHVPKIVTPDADISVYSGTFAGVTSPVRNYTPVIIAKVIMKPNAYAIYELPANFTTFLYVVDGSLQIGEDQSPLIKDQVGWLDRHSEKDNSQLILKSGEGGAQFVLYAAEPQRHEIISYGPFIADTMDDIRQWYADYRQGKMEHISLVNADQKLVF